MSTKEDQIFQISRIDTFSKWLMGFDLAMATGCIIVLKGRANSAIVPPLTHAILCFAILVLSSLILTFWLTLLHEKLPLVSSNGARLHLLDYKFLFVIKIKHYLLGQVFVKALAFMYVMVWVFHQAIAPVPEKSQDFRVRISDVKWQIINPDRYSSAKDQRPAIQISSEITAVNFGVSQVTLTDVKLFAENYEQKSKSIRHLSDIPKIDITKKRLNWDRAPIGVKSKEAISVPVVHGSYYFDDYSYPHDLHYGDTGGDVIVIGFEVEFVDSYGITHSQNLAGVEFIVGPYEESSLKKNEEFVNLSE